MSVIYIILLLMRCYILHGVADNAVIQEYGSLCLSFLATDFTAKLSICSAGGLVQLVRCLCCDDPDIIKNSLEAITLTLQVILSKYLAHVSGNMKCYIHYVAGITVVPTAVHYM